MNSDFKNPSFWRFQLTSFIIYKVWCEIERQNHQHYCNDYDCRADEYHDASYLVSFSFIFIICTTTSFFDVSSPLPSVAFPLMAITRGMMRLLRLLVFMGMARFVTWRLTFPRPTKIKSRKWIRVKLSFKYAGVGQKFLTQFKLIFKKSSD